MHVSKNEFHSCKWSEMFANATFIYTFRDVWIFFISVKIIHFF